MLTPSALLLTVGSWTMTTTKYHIGDLVWVPLIKRGYVWKWHGGQVLTVRRDEVVVESYGHESVHPPHALRPRRLGRPTGYPIVPREDYERAWGRR